MFEEGGYAVLQRYSRWQKKKVRTIVVNTHAKNPSHRSIADAIALAKPFDRIELTGGEYHESVAIQVPLELVASEGEDPHIFSRSSTITIATPGIDVYMESIIVSSRSTSTLDAAIVAVAGNPILFRCHCSSVLIGGTAEAHLDECTIKESGSGVGIVVQDSGGGIIKSSTIRNHRSVCFDIDTRGELAVTECTIDNTTCGDGMKLSGAVSSISRDFGASYLSCSHVEVSHCHFSISGDAMSSGAGGVSMNIVGSACGIVLTQGAAPTIASNEFIEGEIGVLIEGPGTAQLRGNVIRCQRRCGILALVEEGFRYSLDHQTLRISGDNVLDRCRVGIDVQCSNNRASYFQQQSATVAVTGAASGIGGSADAGLNITVNGSHMSGIDRFLADELPNPKRAFEWTPVQGSTPPPSTYDAAYFLSTTSSTNPLVCAESKWYALDKLRSNLQQLVNMALQAHPTCLQPSFGFVAGTVPLVTEGLGANSTNTFADILNDMLGTQLSHQKDGLSWQREMLQLRGNKGIDIVNTKFSNCDVCAIRFGRHGYGLVEECVFEDCGTYAIVVDCAAHPLITGCRFLRSRGASILVTNFANPFIIGNEMVSGKRDGIQLTNMSRGLIVGNIIATHVGTGTRVDKHSQTLICANVISQNREGGISVAEGSKPTILFNHLTGNLQAQVRCTDGADAFISHNRISASADTGIHIDSCSRCTVLSNAIRSNGDGILVERDADPYVKNNEITANTRAGVHARNNALGVFVDNRILDNLGPNVLLTEGASSVFRANRIEGSSQGGVVVCNEGHGFFERNTISANAIANVLVTGAYSEPELLRNVISGSRSGCGIVCARSAGGSFLRNSIFENFQCGVFILEASNPTLRDNNIAREAVGVLVSDCGRGLLTKNVIENCYGTGVLTQRQANPVFSENKVRDCQMSGLHIAPDSIGLFEQNELTRNDIGVHLGSSMDSAVIDIHSVYLSDADPSDTDSSAMAQGRASHTAPRHSSLCPTKTDASVLRSIADAGAQRRTSVVRPASSVVRGNTITANLRGGVLLDSFPSGTVERNVIFRNNAYGILGDATYAAARAQAVLLTKFGAEDCRCVIRPLPVRQQQSSPAQLKTLLLIQANNIHGHDEANILLDHFDGATHETTITENTIYGAPYGVCVAHNSTVCSMSKNEVHTCMDGFAFTSGGHGCYTANHIHDCTYSGVYVSDMAHPSLADSNCIENCGFCGVLVDVSGQGVFRRNTIRHCETGVVVFCGPTTPFHMSHEEVTNARILTSTPIFTENTIEENELHGVLLLSVLSGCPLRSPLILSCGGPSEKSAEASPADPSTDEPLHDAPTPYLGAVRETAVRSDRLCATFEKNVIRRSRMMGVYHDRFDHWDFSALEKTHAERKRSGGNAVKNAYGGYEALLGTSQILDSDEHRQQRQLKQISLIENTITECSVGVGAGYGCHPYLQRNKILNNTFFGLLLRFGSAVSAYANDICGNGLAGVYAASGAKGYIAKGAIESNNGWCRPPTSQHTPRSFADCTFSKSFFTQSMVSTVEDNVRAAAIAAHRPLRMCSRAYEQMTHLAAVHVFIMTDALRYLAELVAASSGGLTLASGCAPSALFDAASGASFGAGGAAASGWRYLGGVALADYADVSTADGGIGVWVQAGSRVTIQGNRISKHQNSGVRITKGVLHHHSVLHKSFRMDDDKKANKKLDMVVSLPDTAKRRTSTASSTAVDIFAVEREAPPLACGEPGALFSTQLLCATGILAALQIAASTTFESLDASFASFLHHSLSLSCPNGLEAEEQRQRVGSLHHAHIADNVISGNRDGVHIEVFHRLQASTTTSAVAATAASVDRTSPSSGGDANSTTGVVPHTPKDARAQQPFRRASTPTLSSTATAVTTAHPASSQDIDVINCAYGTLNFKIVVEGNTVTQNRRYGVYAVHVANVSCERWVPSRSALNTTLAAQYGEIRSKLILGKPTARVEVALPFGVQALNQEVDHALFRKNDLFNNEQTQVYVTSRYVALTQDGDRTLLQLDTTAALSGSNYASQVLIGVPVMASLLQLPPPGVLLWDENKIHDAKSGVRLCGYLGPHSVRFQRNSFVNIADDALSVLGHLACATIGKGNVFDGNGVGLRVAQEQHIGLVTPCSRTPNALRTRIFHNTFKAAKGSSILLECVGEEAPLVYRNEFSGHTQGTVALYLQSGRAGGPAVVQGNVFSDNYTPVVLVGGSESGGVNAPSASPTTLVENRFTCNYVGVIVCNGAAPTLEGNLFEKNARAGLEVVGSGSRPEVRQCVFREHTRDSDAVGSLAGLTHGPQSPSQEINAESTMRYPKQGTLLLQRCNFSLTLLPENTRVLTATSQARLPAGLLLGPFTEPVVDACCFVNNDIGVDAVRDAASPAVALAELKAHVKRCLFSSHRVCGVLVRGSQSTAGRGRGSDGAAKGTAVDHTPTDGTIDASSTLGMADTTVFEQCVFMENATAEGGGDVVAMEDGYATFRGNVFCGTVVGKTRGAACFTQNKFITLSDSGIAALTETAHDSSSRSDGCSSAAAAVVIQEGGRIVVNENTIAYRKVGVQCLPGAEGIATGNRIVQCVTGLLLAPFNRTDVNKNRVLASLDCGAVVYGGRMADNTIITAPIGIFVQHSSAYKGINAVPSHKRSAVEFLCTRNSIVNCAKDGFLIKTAGLFDGNNVSHCKNGINIVSPLSGGPAGSCPVIKNSNIYDNCVGVCMENESESAVRSNDIFDNEVVGVLVGATATGSLQENHISSSMDHGAVEIPMEARIKSHGNVIRNQFSPAFQRGTRASRAKDYQVEQANLDRELRDLDDAIEEAHQNMEAVSSGMRSLQQELVKMHSRSIEDFVTVISGPAGHALRVASARAGKMTTAAGSDRRDVCFTPATRATGNSLSSSEKVKGVASTVAAGARRQSKAGSSTTVNFRGKTASNAIAADTKQVLIHVFTNAESGTRADAIGEAITGVLAKAPLSKYNFLSTISTSTSQLLRLLGGPHPMVPFLCVVVFDAPVRDLSPSDHSALKMLHDSACCASRPAKYRVATQASSIPDGGGASNVGDVSDLFYTVLPSSVFKKDGAAANEERVMSVEAYAAVHHPFTYTASVEEVLDDLHDQISQEMKASTASAAPHSRRRINVPSLQASGKESMVERTSVDEDGHGSHGAAEGGGRFANARGSRSASTFLTTEHVSALFSQLSPEAFGFEPAKETRTVKKRKSCVVDTHEVGDIEGGPDGDKRNRRGSAHAQRGSTVSKAAGRGATASRRRLSTIGAKSGHRGSVASRKS
ncbi:Periplasmic_copper-binding_protein_(NosD)/Right_handed_beta_helix_region_containing_protein [Leishmania braziliensis MHOM/BR/75/M2904]|uniref:Periplasmic_copper-binding_protein_(NosD)/Right_h anded_beta_helix_region_containing_protein n=2 Tax=Leishmania braziliensis TaxID=5660 RepID=A0A3P3Z9Y7_LEIBR|nr:unnamed protein product [Leishmania braziliensis]SYZ67011.1 Periplasmic_copper-binding_protein_(NosD)/Right_handed_beta_helix_region_containing_protein [Leishmania braziliensis MHOM/BR/75/M2904]